MGHADPIAGIGDGAGLLRVLGVDARGRNPEQGAWRWGKGWLGAGNHIPAFLGAHFVPADWASEAASSGVNQIQAAGAQFLEFL